MEQRSTPGGYWMLALVAAGVILGALGALLWGTWHPVPGEPEPVRLTWVGDVRSFLWSRTEPRLLLMRRRGEEPAARWFAWIGTKRVEPWEGTTPAERAALTGEFGFNSPERCVPHITPDGTQVAMVNLDGLALFDVASGKSTSLLRAGTAPSAFVDARFLYGPTWAPDGRRIAFTTLESRSRLPRPVRDRLRSLPGPVPLGESLEEWSRLGVRAGVWVLDTRTGFAWRLFDAGPFDPREGLNRERLWLQWSPDGRRLGFIREGDVWAVPVETR
ncbi:MAG TPA: hypothetical protein GX715_16930 [Armatimonadetes bacterium]|jgi:hypothetical protein|nr:hypothetical protein [Armatimonadota bacterium]